MTTDPFAAMTELIPGLEAMEADRKALADVRTLDGWAAEHKDNRVNMNHYGAQGDHPGWSIQMISIGAHRTQRFGATPDEARAEAAAWVRGLR